MSRSLARRRTATVPLFYPDWLVVEPLSRCMERFLEKFASGVFLDAGCGAGPFRDTVQPYVKTYIGLDMHEGDGIDLVSSVTQVPLANESVDTVLCSQVLEHVFDYQKGFSEIARVLRRGGHAIISVPQYGAEHEVPNDFFRFTSFALRRLAMIHGFDVVAEERQGGPFAIAGWAINTALGDHVLPKRRGTAIWYALASIMGVFFLATNVVCYLLDALVRSRHDCINRCVVLRKTG